MSFLSDNPDFQIRPVPNDRYVITKDGITASKKFIVSGPVLPDGTGDYPEIGDTLILLSASADVPHVGDAYDPLKTSPICESVTIEEVVNGDSETCRLYRITAEYVLNLQNSTLSFVEYDSGSEAYILQDGQERVYTIPQAETAHIDSSHEGGIFQYPPTEEKSVLIGADEDGRISGVDIQDFGAVLVVERNYLLKNVDYKVFSLALGKTNGVAFYGYEVGECLFVGMQEVSRSQPFKNGATDGEIMVRIEFRFRISENALVGDLPTYVDKTGANFEITNGKTGWQYLWARPVTIGDESENKVRVLTEKVQVHTVYDVDDFITVLGVSGAFPV